MKVSGTWTRTINFYVVLHSQFLGDDSVVSVLWCFLSCGSSADVSFGPQSIIFSIFHLSLILVLRTDDVLRGSWIQWIAIQDEFSRYDELWITIHRLTSVHQKWFREMKQLTILSKLTQVCSWYLHRFIFKKAHIDEWLFIVHRIDCTR